METRKEQNGIIRVNKFALERMLKKAASLALVGTMSCSILGGVVGYQFGFHEAQATANKTVPYGYVLTQTEDQIGMGGSITDTASQYYSPRYASMYENIDEYARIIEEINGLHHNETVHPGQTIHLPVMVDETNPHYLQTLLLQSQIEEIEQNEYWVSHEVKLGESISILAARASGSESETARLIQKILERNNKETTEILHDGETIWIVNPRLGPLKISLQEEEDALREELKAIADEQNQIEETKKPLS